MTETGTAAALLDAAEARFAAEGIEAASLRAVMRDAGTDPGAVHYHFKGREALAEAVLDRTLVPLNDRRIELLDEVVAARTPPSVETLVGALVRPDLEVAGALEARGSGRSRLLGTIYLTPSKFVMAQVERRFAPVATRFMPSMSTALPSVHPSTLAWRVRWCLFGTLGALLLDPDEVAGHSSTTLANRLIPPLAAALAAPTITTRSTR